MIETSSKHLLLYIFWRVFRNAENKTDVCFVVQILTKKFFEFADYISLSLPLAPSLQLVPVLLYLPKTKISTFNFYMFNLRSCIKNCIHYKVFRNKNTVSVNNIRVNFDLHAQCKQAHDRHLGINAL